MAGFKLFGLSYWLADRVTEVISAAGALVAPLALAHTWTAAQSASRTTLAIAAAHVAWSAATAKQHMQLTLTGAAEIDAPSGTLVADTPYMLAIVGDGTTNPTWASIFDWGGTAPDFSAVTAGKIAWVSMIVWSATRIHCAANLGIDGVGFAGTP